MFYLTTTDWLTFSAPQLLFDPGFATIDLTVISEDDTVYGVAKAEIGGHKDRYVFAARGGSITSLRGARDILPAVGGVEGPQLLKLLDGSYRLYYDFFAFNDRSWGAARSDDLFRWTEITPDPVFPDGVRHGSIFIVAKKEVAAILSAYNTAVPLGWGNPEFADADDNGTADPVTLTVAENTTSGNVGSAVTAVDPNRSDASTYSVAAVSNSAGRHRASDGVQPRFQRQRLHGPGHCQSRRGDRFRDPGQLCGLLSGV